MITFNQSIAVRQSMNFERVAEESQSASGSARDAGHAGPAALHLSVGLHAASAPRYGASISSVVDQGTKTMDDPQREQRQISVRACVSSTTLFLSPLVGINRPAPSSEMKSRTNTGINRSFGWVPYVTSECGLTAGNRPARFLPAGCPQTCEGSVLTFEPHHKPAVNP